MVSVQPHSVVRLTDPVKSRIGLAAALVVSLGFAPESPPYVPGGAFVDIAIPSPIITTALDQYARIVQLDDVQRALLHLAYERYLEVDQQFRAKELKPLWDESAKIATRGDLGTNPETAALYSALMERREKVVNRLVDFEKRVFTDLEPHLAEWQLPLLEQSRRQRIRERCNDVHCEYPGGAMDLTVLVDDVRNSSTPAILDEEELDALLSEYDIAVTPLFERRYRAKLKIMIEDCKLLADTHVSQEDLAVKWEAALKKREQLRGPYVDVAKRIRQLNEEYLRRLLEVAEVLGRSVEAVYRPMVYPTVYPDSHEIGSFAQKVLSLETLSETQREAIEAMISQYAERQQILSNKMVDRFLSWHEQLSRRWSKHPDEVEQYERDMKKLDEQRAANAATTRSQIKGILGPAQLMEVEEEHVSVTRDESVIPD